MLIICVIELVDSPIGQIANQSSLTIYMGQITYKAINFTTWRPLNMTVEQDPDFLRDGAHGK